MSTEDFCHGHPMDTRGGLNEKTPAQAAVSRARLAETKARQKEKTYSAPRRRGPC